MSEFEHDFDDVLRRVWLRHRDSVLDDLTTLIDRVVESFGASSPSTAVSGDIRVRAHRIAGSLSMVGLTDQVGVLRIIEADDAASIAAAGNAEEVVDRLHDLLDRLRNAR